MRITIAAVGRLKAGAERELLDRYVERAAAAGARLGLTFALRETPESRASRAADRRADEAAALGAFVPPSARLVVLDEAGDALTSTAFADRLARWRDGGDPDLVFLIGGADGLDPALAARASFRLAFGAMTWPHQLVRAMLAEQLYRAVTILAGHPYHRA